MLGFIRQYVTWQRLMLACGALIIAALIAPFTTDYAPLRDKLAQRYSERDSQATIEQRNQEAAKAREAAEAARRNQATTENQRLISQYDPLVAEFRRILGVHRPPVETMLKNVSSALNATVKAASSPSFYNNGYLTPEETTNSAACRDPATTVEMWNRNTRRDRNIFACAVFLSTHPREAPEVQRYVTMALLQRVNDSAENGHYPFQTVIAFIWLQYLAHAVNEAQALDAFPALETGQAYNPALFHNTLSSGFAQRMIETATISEKLQLSDKVYPDLRMMAQLGSQIVQTCKLMQRKHCLVSD